MTHLKCQYLSLPLFPTNELCQFSKPDTKEFVLNQIVSEVAFPVFPSIFPRLLLSLRFYNPISKSFQVYPKLLKPHGVCGIWRIGESLSGCGWFRQGNQGFFIEK